MKIRDFFMRDRKPQQPARERVADMIEDLLQQADEITVVKVRHGNVGPLGGESSQINAVTDSGVWVTINIYGSEGD